MKNWTNLLCSLFTAVVLAGCQSSSAEQDLKAKPAPNQEPARLILMATDDTGSYRLWDQAKDIACRIIMQLELHRSMQHLSSRAPPDEGDRLR
jgi:hypothetical protein